MLQKLIKKIEDKIAEYESSIESNETTTMHKINDSGRVAAYRDTIQLLTDALPEFEECIKKAYSDGQDNDYTPAQDYYNQNYKK